MTVHGGATRPPAYPFVVALFSAVLYLALIICAFGFISLLTDTDVVARPDTGPLLGPLSVATAVVIALISFVRRVSTDRSVRKKDAGHPRIPVAWILGVGLFTWVGYAVAAGTLYMLQASVVSFVFVLAETLIGAYGVAVGLLGAAVALCFVLVLAGTGNDPVRPLWPWERRDGDGRE